jgi:hypothetical protein
MHMRSFYMTEYFGEGKLLGVGILVCAVLVVISLVALV